MSLLGRRGTSARWLPQQVSLRLGGKTLLGWGRGGGAPSPELMSADRAGGVRVGSFPTELTTGEDQGTCPWGRTAGWYDKTGCALKDHDTDSRHSYHKSLVIILGEPVAKRTCRGDHHRHQPHHHLHHHHLHHHCHPLPAPIPEGAPFKYLD